MTKNGAAKICAGAHEVAQRMRNARAAGKTLVSTNGCFDILHAGHVQYLYQAAQLGDFLVVGVNCDEVVRRHKGPGRPVQGQADRTMIIAALEMVDYAFVFEEDDPRAFLEILRPDIHVKGGDYDADTIIEKAVVETHGGRVQIVPFLTGRSTSSIVARTAGARQD
jgi:D-beta-D-heptose 7-phosphate kinase / D-beta-D-heptose 1-phosphate adenosyltransferase